MDQLSGLDAAFIHQDSPRTPMHVSAVLFYDATDKQLDMATVQALVETRLSHEPLFHRKLQRVSFDADAPYWVPGGTVSKAYHFRGHQLAAVDAWPALCRLLQTVHGEAMELNRPLWQLHLVSGLDHCPGLPERCQAIVLKAHHAGVDGVSLARLMHLLHDGAGDRPGSPVARPRLPHPLSVWSRASFNSMGRPLKFADTMARLVRGMPQMSEARQADDTLPPVLAEGACFNAIVSEGRSVGMVMLPASELKAIRRAVRGLTANDVASCIIAGGLREYLHLKKQLPEASLAAGMPVNLRNGRNSRSGSNQIATMAVGLATDVADPLERSARIHRYALLGKRRIRAFGTGTIMDISDSLAPTVLAGGLQSLAWASSLGSVPVPFHTMISNVPGPVGEAKLDALPLAAAAGLGPVRDNMGLFHVISGAADTVSLSFNACSRLLPDADMYARCILDSCRALHAAAVS